jgi:hypothetical protein
MNTYLADIAKSENASPVAKMVADLMSNGYADPYIDNKIAETFGESMRETSKHLRHSLTLICQAAPSPH